MKLTDIGATRGSRAATAKLARQVQKSSVAAGKAAKTNLEVLGISIGQTQSTGDTSTVTEAKGKHTVQEVLLALADTINYKGKPLPTGKDRLTQEAYAQAVQIARLYDSSSSHEANELYDALGDFVRWQAKLLRNLGDFETIIAKQALLIGPIADTVLSIKKMREQAPVTSSQWQGVVKILEFVDEFSGRFDDPDPLIQALCVATAKQLGMSTT